MLCSFYVAAVKKKLQHIYHNKALTISYKSGVLTDLVRRLYIAIRIVNIGDWNSIP